MVQGNIKYSRAIKWIIALWFIGKIGGCYFGIPGVWGPEISGQLPDGGKVIFQSQPVGRETNDRLTLISSEGKRQDYWVDQIHAGFSYIIIKLKDDGTGIWIESDDKVGASLNLITGDFRDEHSPQFEWAHYGHGKKIAEGRTWSLLNIILPW